MSSTDWYDANAASFAARTLGLGMDSDRVRFLAHVPAGGAILEAGCGAGRDALAFSRAGYAVTAFDGAEALAKLASETTGLAVRHLTFGEMDWDAEFDGVWACSSLLHLPGGELKDAFARIRRALKQDGVFYCSFKLGTGERQANGRHFTDLTEATLTARLADAGCAVIELWTAPDGRDDHPDEFWVAAISRRA